ncbi:MAG: M48 family metallopeptidase [Candidatus Goldbacteria bacterium]|nr:M48 family metallopeptidase [Candidatus Goldiibacteriota bacterium]
MKYIPKLPDGDINAPTTNLLKDFIYFLAILILVIIFIYVFLGFLVDIVAEKISPEFEEKLAYNYMMMFEKKPITVKEKKLQKFLNDLVSYTDLKNRKFNARILETKQVNALAMPGGNIIVLSGLLKTVKTENQLAYVLYHELGHYAHKDHLRGLGRGLVLSLIATVLFGSDTFFNRTLSSSISNIQLKYTRSQEIKADLYAIDLLYKKYKNVAGATDLLIVFGKNEPASKAFSLFTTHPHYSDRIKAIDNYIKKKNYKVLMNSQIKLNL